MSALALPEPDREASPRTGWSRAHWEACADHLLRGALRHASPSGSLVHFPGDDVPSATDGLEGFARSFLLGALRLAGDPSDGPAERYAAALAAGATPGHAEAWPRIGHHDQALVEATAVALGLHWSRASLWDRLPEPTRQRLVDWLSGARGAWCADNNHVLFGATVQAFLASVGADHDPAAIDGALDRIEEWYAGDGWYSDGAGRRFDHYNAWTFHLYPFFIEQLLGGAPGALRRFDVHRSRLRMFLDDYQHLFDSGGAPVLQGRSLIYRWAMAAPFWMGELQAASPLPPGRTRRLASGLLAGFVRGGDLDTGVLPLGWHGPARHLLQSYNRPGSPLWASKGFLGLLLPADHPVWTAREEPLPTEERDIVRPLAGPGWVVQSTVTHPVVRLLNHGSDGHPRKDDPLYRRLAFSSATVPVTVAGLADNSVAVGPGAAHRGLRAGVVRRAGAASRFRLDARGRDVAVDIATLLLDSAELRLARVRGALDEPVRCTGYALPASDPVEVATGPRWASARRADGLTSLVAVVAGDGVPAVLHGAQATALGTHTGLPYATFPSGVDGEVRLAWLVHLGHASWSVESQLAGLSVTWTDDGARVSAGTAVHAVAWAGADRWRADEVNQGIFRVSATT